MSGKPISNWQHGVRLVLAAVVALTMLLPPTTIEVSAAPGDRTLYLFHTHTKQTGRFTYKRNGQFDQRVLRELDAFLADWRTKEPTKMDPALFDLLWSVYQEVGATQPINIVSSYRSPRTNAMLARRSSGVADNSQHIRGKAMDFFIPGIGLTKLREVAMRHQVGGVGYYPTSGSPFVHIDTGNVRAWPRMTRAQLKKVFPDGRTLHLPTDGKPLSNEGRRYAELEWKKCRTVPCNGRIAAPTTMLASLDAEAPIPAVKPRTLMSTLFGDDQQAEAEIQLASLREPTQRTVSTIDIAAPIPLTRSSAGLLVAGMVDESGAPIPATKSPRLVLATRSALPGDNGETALSALAALGDAPIPQPRVLMTAKPQPDIVTAYAPAGEPDPLAQLTLRGIIEQETTGSIAVSPPLEPMYDASAIRTASLGGGLDGLKTMFDMTFDALTKGSAPTPMAAALVDLAQSRQPNPSIKAREVELVAPEIDHVNETLVHPVFMSSAHFAVLTEAEGYLDKETELGPLSGQIAFLSENGLPLEYDRFVSRAPLFIAAR